MATSALDTDTLYTRYGLRDSLDNESAWTAAEKNVFVREEEAASGPPGSPIHRWDAMGGTSITTTTDSLVTQWDDEIGSWDLVRYGTGEEPVYNSNRSINGNEAISFYGDRYVLYDNTTEIPIGGTGRDYTIAVSFLSDGDPTGYMINVTDGNGVGNPAVLTTVGDMAVYPGAVVGVGTIAETTGYHNIVLTFEATGTLSNAWLDGVQVVTDDATGSVSSGEDVFVVGDIWHGYDGFAGLIGEIIIYDSAVSSTVAGEIDTYFGRWD
jgi:hypothetical protein